MNPRLSAGLLPLLLFALVLAGCGLDGSTTSLVPGQPVELRLGVTGANLDLDLTEDGFYSFFTDGDQDTVCEIKNEAGEVLAEDDDSGVDLNCRFHAPLQAGSYRIEIRGYDLSDRGWVNAHLVKLPVERVRPGQVIGLALEPGAGAVVSLALDQAVTVSLGTSGQLDTICTLYDGHGIQVGHNDDFGADHNCRLIEPLKPGEYHVLLMGYGGEAGRTTFLAQLLAPVRVSLAPGSEQAARLDDLQPLLQFETDIDASGMYVFRTSGDTDTICQLHDANGELLAENDDATDHNCRIRHALAAGSYRFTVRGYDGADGEFIAHVDQRH